MKPTPLTLGLLTAALIAAAFFTSSSSAQVGQKKNLTLRSLINTSVTVRYNPHSLAPYSVSGTLEGVESNGVLVQTPKAKVWIPMEAILLIEAP